MFAILLIIHILVALLLVLSVMLQTGQAGGLSGAFGGGGGGAQSVLGRGASNFLTKATAYLAAAFMVVCFTLAFVQAHRSAAKGTGGRNIIREQLAPSQEAPPQETAAPGTGTGMPIESAPIGEEGSSDLPVETGTPAEPVPPQPADGANAAEPTPGG